MPEAEYFKLRINGQCAIADGQIQDHIEEERYSAAGSSKWISNRGRVGVRMGAACTQTGVLAKGRAECSAGEIEELGRELGLAFGLFVRVMAPFDSFGRSKRSAAEKRP